MHPAQAAKNRRAVKRKENKVFTRSASIRKLLALILKEQNHGTK